MCARPSRAVYGRTRHAHNNKIKDACDEPSLSNTYALRDYAYICVCVRIQAVLLRLYEVTNLCLWTMLMLDIMAKGFANKRRVLADRCLGTLDVQERNGTSYKETPFVHYC